MLGTVEINAGTLSVGADGTTTTYDGLLTGVGGLNKVGSAGLTLTAANDYAAGTTVTSGVLSVESNSALGTGAISVAGGAL